MGVIAEVPLIPVDIIVDSREASKQKEIVNSLRSAGIRVAVSALSVGDYYLMATEGKKPVLVERKSVIDFTNSIRDNRIWEQLKLLKQAEEEEELKPVIIIEGNLNTITKFTKWNITAVLRVIDEIVLNWEIPVIPSPSRDATVKWLIAKAKALGETGKKKPPRLRVKKKPLSINDRILYVAEGLVGPTLARKLLEHFKTLRNIANASSIELMRVEGIGEKRAKEIYLIFNTPWKPS